MVAHTLILIILLVTISCSRQSSEQHHFDSSDSTHTTPPSLELSDHKISAFEAWINDLSSGDLELVNQLMDQIATISAKVGAKYPGYITPRTPENSKDEDILTFRFYIEHAYSKILRVNLSGFYESDSEYRILPHRLRSEKLGPYESIWGISKEELKTIAKYVNGIIPRDFLRSGQGYNENNRYKQLDFYSFTDFRYILAPTIEIGWSNKHCYGFDGYKNCDTYEYVYAFEHLRQYFLDYHKDYSDKFVMGVLTEEESRLRTARSLFLEIVIRAEYWDIPDPDLKTSFTYFSKYGAEYFYIGAYLMHITDYTRIIRNGIRNYKDNYFFYDGGVPVKTTHFGIRNFIGLRCMVIAEIENEIRSLQTTIKFIKIPVNLNKATGRSQHTHLSDYDNNKDSLTYKFLLDLKNDINMMIKLYKDLLIDINENDAYNNYSSELKSQIKSKIFELFPEKKHIRICEDFDMIYKNWVMDPRNHHWY